MALGVWYGQKIFPRILKFFRFSVYKLGIAPPIFKILCFFGGLHLIKEPILNLCYRKMQIDLKKKAQLREDEIKDFTSDETFTTMDGQQIKMNEFQDQFVIVIKTSNKDKLNKISQLLIELKNYNHTAFVILNDFENPEILESKIYDHAYFVTSNKSSSTFKDSSICLLFPQDQQMLVQQIIPQNISALKKSMKMKMNRKLDQKYKKSINFGILKK